MASLLDQGAQWLSSQRHQHLTQTVTYVRGGAAVTLSTTKGRSTFEQLDEHGLATRIESTDFLLRAADLVLDGVATLPRSGDQVQETIGGVTYRYEIRAPGGVPPWRYADHLRLDLRVHTKLIGQEGE